MLLLSAVSVLPALIALVIFGWLAVQQSQERVSYEAQTLARTIGNHLDYIFGQNMERLSNVQFAADINISDENTRPERNALHNTFLGSIFDFVFITDTSGNVLISEPISQELTGADISDYQPIALALLSTRPTVSSSFNTPDGRDVLYMISPLKNREGTFIGLVGGEILLTKENLHEIILPLVTEENSYIDVIDSDDTVLASSNRNRVLTKLENDPKITTEKVKLTGIPWYVALSQPKEKALAPVNTLEVRFFITAGVVLVIVFFLSWGMAYSIIKPIGQLNTAAQNISKGNLLQPVPELGSDEIGELGRSFDTMRTELKKSLEEIQEWNRQLEMKIEERTQQLQNSYREIEQKENARGQLLQKLLLVQEEERKRVARELHDETTQSILGLIMKLEAATDIPDSDIKRIKSTIDNVKELAADTLDNVHKLIFDLRPSVLDDLGLLSAIHWYAQNRLGETGIKVRLEVTGTEKELPPQIETALFRVVQEAITNIAKHAQAQNTLIHVEYKAHTISIEIEDDGLGLDTDKLSPQFGESHGLGLLGMKERVELLGGTFKIESQPDAGTEITIEVPLD